jgi:LDH2 family malate/lactate/ureidoglycolate dehydrogenase
MAAYYAMEALPLDMIGFAFCNALPKVAVYGGIDGQMGTNPICAAIPASEEFPVVFDAATTKIAWNKIRYASKEGLGIESEVALDENGNDTQDPTAALAGVLLPFAGYKGSGLAIVVNILCSLLSGAAVNIEADEPREKVGKVGFYFSAVDIAAFQEPSFFKKSVDLMIRRMKSSRVRKGFDRIYMPGELEYIQFTDQTAKGVELGDAVLAELRGVGGEFGLEL